jgi:hypothetical protein
LEARVVVTTYNHQVRLLSPERSWLVATKVYSATGADIVMESITLKTTRESAVAGYRGLLWPFKIRRMAAIVFQFRVVAGAP